MTKMKNTCLACGWEGPGERCVAVCPKCGSFYVHNILITSDASRQEQAIKAQSNGDIYDERNTYKVGQ